MRIETILGAERVAVKRKVLMQCSLSFSLSLICVGCTSQKPVSHIISRPAFYKDERTGREAFAVPRQAAPLFDPKLAPSLLDDPKRDTWQKPQQIVDALKLKNDDNVADIGSGSGYLLPYLSRAVGKNGLVFAEEIQSDYFSTFKTAHENT